MTWTMAPRWPRALIVMALAIVAVEAFDLDSRGVAVTGHVPTGPFSAIPDSAPEPRLPMKGTSIGTDRRYAS